MNDFSEAPAGSTGGMTSQCLPDGLLIDLCGDSDAHPRNPESNKGPLILQGFPFDVLLEVFALVYASHELTSHTSTPLSLSHVCRSWRAAALSYPSLWSTIRVHHETAPDGLTMLAIAYLLDLYLVRSRTAPLDICWIAHDSLAAVFCALLPHSSRWRSLNIISRILPAISGARPQMPLLESTRVEGQWYWSWTTVRDAFSAVPRLGSWACNCPKTNELALPWAQLTDVEFKVLGSECLSWLPSFIPQMTSLRRAVLRMEGIAENPRVRSSALKGSTVWPPSLREVEFDLTDAAPGVIMHSSTLSPRLRVFSVKIDSHSRDVDSHMSGQTFAEMAERSGLRQGALNVLQLEGVDLSPRDLEIIKESIPAHAEIRLKRVAGLAQAR
ncbi:uncharacterized protein SCHCODRAFT_02694046 [Schizophyllum commune H4-8]|nr:uncharacterized protein SCHCODRAFT_02694046 [Schizophyllum commune H4-8]KAI5885013.1 hypothetical protein SCHCODRAFT_02694046 [Schizophyllum commune H4-8]